MRAITQTISTIILCYYNTIYLAIKFKHLYREKGFSDEPNHENYGFKLIYFSIIFRLNPALNLL
jgi:hypothetical protein